MNTSWARIKWHHCQGPLRGHESAETPIGNESNGAVAGDGATLQWYDIFRVLVIFITSLVTFYFPFTNSFYLFLFSLFIF